MKTYQAIVQTTASHFTVIRLRAENLADALTQARNVGMALSCTLRTEDFTPEQILNMAFADLGQYIKGLILNCKLLEDILWGHILTHPGEDELIKKCFLKLHEITAAYNKTLEASNERISNK